MALESWLLDKLGGGFFSGLVSAPLSFAITKGLQAAFPSQEAQSIADIQKTVNRMEGQISSGFDAVQSRIGTLEKHLDTQFKGLKALIPEQFATTFVEDIGFWYGCLARETDLDKIAGARPAVQKAIATVCHVLVGGHGSGQEHGLLASWVDDFASCFRGVQEDGEALLAFYLLLEARLDHKLVHLLQGVAVCQYAYQREANQAGATAFRRDFIGTQLKTLFSEFMFQVEVLVLAYVGTRKLDLAAASGSTHRNLSTVVPYIFKRTDLFVFGVLAQFTRAQPAGHWITGRVIGGAMDIAQGQARWQALGRLAQAGHADDFAPFEGSEVVTHALTLVGFCAPDLFHLAPRELLAPEHTPVRVLRYRVSGVPDALAAVADAATGAEPAMDALGLLSAWDKGFLDVAARPGTAQAPAWRHRIEFAFGRPFSIGPVCQRPSQPDAPFNTCAHHGAVWQAQLLRAAQALWNRRHAEPDAVEPRGALQPVTVLQVAHDGRWWITDAWDHALDLRSLADGQVLRRIPASGQGGHTAAIQALALADDSSLIATGSEDGSCKVWHAADGTLAFSIAAHARGVRAVALCTRRQLLVTGGEDGSVKLWRLGDGQAVRELRAASGAMRPILALGLTPDGARLACASTEASLIWNLDSNALVATLPGARTASVWLRDQQPLCALAQVAGRQIAIVDLTDGATVQTLKLPAEHGQPDAFAVAPERPWAATASSSSPFTITLWDLTRGVPLAVLPGHTNTVRALAFDRAGTRLFSGSHDHEAIVWDLASGSALQRIHLASPGEDQHQADLRIARLQRGAAGDFLLHDLAPTGLSLAADNGLVLDFAQPGGAVLAAKIAPTAVQARVQWRWGLATATGARKLSLLAADGRPFGRSGDNGPLTLHAAPSAQTQFDLELIGGGLCALKADNGRYLVRTASNTVTASGTSVTAAEAQWLASCADAEAAPCFIWQNGGRLDAPFHVTAAIQLGFWHDGNWAAGSQTDCWYAPLFIYAGPPVELEVGVLIGRFARGFGYDQNFSVEYAIICVPEDGAPADLEQKSGQKLPRTHVFKDEVSGHPGKGYAKWEEWSLNATTFGQGVVRLEKGMRVWLEGKGTVGYPKNEFWEHRSKAQHHMDIDLGLRLLDIVLRWRDTPAEALKPRDDAP